MITADMLATANSKVKTIGIHGKDYATVFERVKAFRSICPNGEITTQLVHFADGICVYHATVRNEDGKVLGTGSACEKEGSSNINKTSYVENCETSAVGRALAFCGIGSDSSIASAEEVMAATINEAVENKIRERMALENAKVIISPPTQPAAKQSIDDAAFAKALIGFTSRQDMAAFDMRYEMTESQRKTFNEYGAKHYAKPS